MILGQGKIFYTRVLALASVIALVSTCVFLILGGCSGTDTSNRFYELLKLVPAELKDTGYIIVIDYASFYKDNDITFTNFEELTEELKTKPPEILKYMPGSDSFITGYSKYAQHSTIREKYVGYDVGDVDAEIQFGIPPATGVAAIGRFDPQATRDALSHQDEWPTWAKDAYATEEYRGVTIHSWGDGFKIHMNSPLLPPHIDELGQARPLAISEQYLFYAASVTTIKSMIDSSQDKAESLADVPEFASIAKGLSDLNAYTAIVGDESLANGNPEYVELYRGPRLKKFELFGSGLGRDEKGIYLALVLIHKSGTDASANIPLLKQCIAEGTSVYTDEPWSEYFIDTQIDVEGNVLLAKLYTENSGLYANWFFGRDTLLLHEQE